MNPLTINADQGTQTINRHIYGHFAEHLGRCIYEGFWVGEDSPIPNTRGIRNDLVEALEKLDIPSLRWPGGFGTFERALERFQGAAAHPHDSRRDGRTPKRCAAKPMRRFESLQK